MGVYGDKLWGVKLSVYVRDDLAERLTAVKDHLNVSEVCQAALSTAVAAAEAARRGDQRQRIVERLKRSRTPQEDLLERGLIDGRRWAADEAALSELRALESGGAAAAQVVRGWAIPSASIALQEAYATGFREGALEVWELVRKEFDT